MSVMFLDLSGSYMSIYIKKHIPFTICKLDLNLIFFFLNLGPLSFLIFYLLDLPSTKKGMFKILIISLKFCFSLFLLVTLQLLFLCFCVTLLVHKNFKQFSIHIEGYHHHDYEPNLSHQFKLYFSLSLSDINFLAFAFFLLSIYMAISFLFF